MQINVELLDEFKEYDVIESSCVSTDSPEIAEHTMEGKAMFLID